MWGVAGRGHVWGVPTCRRPKVGCSGWLLPKPPKIGRDRGGVLVQKASPPNVATCLFVKDCSSLLCFTTPALVAGLLVYRLLRARRLISSSAKDRFVGSPHWIFLLYRARGREWERAHTPSPMSNRLNQRKACKPATSQHKLSAVSESAPDSPWFWSPLQSQSSRLRL